MKKVITIVIIILIAAAAAYAEPVEVPEGHVLYHFGAYNIIMPDDTVISEEESGNGVVLLISLKLGGPFYYFNMEGLSSEYLSYNDEDYLKLCEIQLKLMGFYTIESAELKEINGRRVCIWTTTVTQNNTPCPVYGALIFNEDKSSMLAAYHLDYSGVPLEDFYTEMDAIIESYHHATPEQMESGTEK